MIHLDKRKLFPQPRHTEAVTEIPKEARLSLIRAWKWNSHLNNTCLEGMRHASLGAGEVIESS